MNNETLQKVLLETFKDSDAWFHVRERHVGLLLEALREHGLKIVRDDPVKVEPNQVIRR